LERGCVQSPSRSTLKGSAASGIFQQAGFAKLLRLVFDTAALQGQCADAPDSGWFFVQAGFRQAWFGFDSARFVRKMYCRSRLPA
jgi:hypothetical protein